ncbi:MAG: precorrin-6y C5,15-methyltransferase (decarboxylating) subunit CbiE [Lachnospiraceae bacterium]|nr:precorrin-6y C5,15-methyltransferase (decarboxylating) subunit CbiE [Lachnospiraceae bacterium]
MKVSLIGCGPGGRGAFTDEALSAIGSAQAVLGPERLLNVLAGIPGEKEEGTAAVYPVKTYTEDALNLLRRLAAAGDVSSACVLYSGDSGFYSGAGRLCILLDRLTAEESFETEILPGLSSASYFAGKLKESWQDWRLLSSHGRFLNIRKEVCLGKPVFVLTGGIENGLKLCYELIETGLSDLPAAIGYDLSYEDESVEKDSVWQIAERLKELKKRIPVFRDEKNGENAGLLVMLFYPAPHKSYPNAGIPDREFIRGNRPMTKREVRALAMAKLQPAETDVVLDIGAGTGGMSIELAMYADLVYAVEKEEEGIRLLLENKEKFGAWNLLPFKERAPEVFYGALRERLKNVNAVFIGGSDGSLSPILGALFAMAPDARICLTAITIETLQEAVSVLSGAGYETDITLVSVSRSVKAGEKHLMKAENPVYLIFALPPGRTISADPALLG